MKLLTMQNMDSKFISIISPVYGAEKIVDELVKQITDAMVAITNNYEILLVEDNSPDRSWQKIEAICKVNDKVKGVRLSRNFGQHNAIAAGLYLATGDYLIVMDCDLQDNPKYIKTLIDKAEEGNDIVYTYKNTRNHNFIKNFISFFWSKIFNWLLDDKSLNNNLKIGGYSLITKKVQEEYNRLNDFYRPYLSMLKILGFTHTYVEIEHDKRFEGKSSYTLKKLIMHSVNGIISQTNRLLTISIFTGMSFSIIGFLLIIYIVYLRFTHGFSPGWASLAVLIIFNTGLILMSTGIIGAYIGKIFLQTKNRPHFIVDKKLNM